MCSLDEFHEVVRHFGLYVPPAAIDDLFALFDGDGSGEPGVILGLDALMSRDEVVISTRPAPHGRPRMQL